MNDPQEHGNGLLLRIVEAYLLMNYFLTEIETLVLIFYKIWWYSKFICYDLKSIIVIQYFRHYSW